MRELPVPLSAAGLWIALVLVGCPGTLEEAGDDRPCEDIAQAISYATFNCTADSELANRRYDSFLSNYTCVASAGLDTQDHYGCAGVILGAPCPEVERLGDDLDGWLGLSSSCADTVSTEAQTVCANSELAVGQALAAKTNTCWNRLEYTQVIGAGLRSDFSCVDGTTDEATDLCVQGLEGAPCLRIPSIDGWLEQVPACGSVVGRSRDGAGQACAEISEALWWGAVTGCGLSLPDAEALQRAFAGGFTCSVDLRDSAQRAAHRTCLSSLMVEDCARLDEASRLDVTSWMANAPCAEAERQ